MTQNIYNITEDEAKKKGIPFLRTGRFTSSIMDIPYITVDDEVARRLSPGSSHRPRAERARRIPQRDRTRKERA